MRRLGLAAAQLASPQHGADARRHGLDGDLADDLVRRHIDREDAEGAQDDGACDDADAVGDRGVAQVVPPFERLFEARVVGQQRQQRNVQNQKKRQAEAVHVEAEPPHLHGHEQRQREQDRAAECASEADPELFRVARPVVLRASTPAFHAASPAGDAGPGVKKRTGQGVGVSRAAGAGETARHAPFTARPSLRAAGAAALTHPAADRRASSVARGTASCRRRPEIP